MSRSRRKLSDLKSTQKSKDLEQFVSDGVGQRLTSNDGLPINDDQNSLKGGERGPSLLEDFLLREKITHFDHERIPERIVHARGSAAHGFFQVYESMAPYTKAAFLQDPALRTPVFVRFSTVAGSRGSTDLARDVRGFATKFYTTEGNYDLVGNNMPVFFIQDAIKFPDLIHAVKPEQHHEMPQAASAHDTFWDFISLMPEAAHMIMWVMSDRAIPRSYRMMEGFGVHTFRFINARDKSVFVKFHWKPLLGMDAVVWDEAQKISGKDPDFHRRDLFEAIENGDFPEYELGVQIVEEKDELKFGFDLLDPTKLLPEELVPVRRIGKMTLNRNPDNFFAETEQVAFNPGRVVPGIDFSNDPLLQGRLFSYTDTQLIRLGGPNHHEIPINRPVAPMHNNQRGGFMRQAIDRGRVSYQPNSIQGNDPAQVKKADGGFVSHAQALGASKVRARSESFFDHFSQATLFYRSQTAVEQNHIVKALRFELGKVEIVDIRARMIAILGQIDRTLAARVAKGLGLPASAKVDGPLNLSIPADGNPKPFQPRTVDAPERTSPALSILRTPKDGIRTRKVAILATDGVDDASLAAFTQALTKAGAQGKIVAERLGKLKTAGGKAVVIDFSLLTTSSVLFDAVCVPGGKASVDTLQMEPEAAPFIQETYRHCKAIGGTDEGAAMIEAALDLAGGELDDGVVLQRGGHRKLAGRFIDAIAAQRYFNREKIED